MKCGPLIVARGVTELRRFGLTINWNMDEQLQLSASRETTRTPAASQQASKLYSHSSGLACSCLRVWPKAKTVCVVYVCRRVDTVSMLWCVFSQSTVSITYQKQRFYINQSCAYSCGVRQHHTVDTSTRRLVLRQKRHLSYYTHHILTK